MAIVMAGGRATRFAGNVEKGLLTVGNATLLERCLDALSVDEIDEILVATSPHTPMTREKAARLGAGSIETAGEGYHEDIDRLLGIHNRFLTLNVDVPFVNRSHVTRLTGAFDGRSIAAVVPQSILDTPVQAESTGIDEGHSGFIWVGLNIVTSDPDTLTLPFEDPLLAVNINDEADLARAREIALVKGI